MNLSGYKVYIVAFLAAVPDILTGIGAVDLSAILPTGYSTAVATLLAVGRIMATAIAVQVRSTPR